MYKKKHKREDADVDEVRDNDGEEETATMVVVMAESGEPDESTTTTTGRRQRRLRRRPRSLQQGGDGDTAAGNNANPSFGGGTAPSGPCVPDPFSGITCDDETTATSNPCVPDPFSGITCDDATGEVENGGGGDSGSGNGDTVAEPPPSSSPCVPDPFSGITCEDDTGADTYTPAPDGIGDSGGDLEPCVPDPFLGITCDDAVGEGQVEPCVPDPFAGITCDEPETTQAPNTATDNDNDNPFGGDGAASEPCVPDPFAGITCDDTDPPTTTAITAAPECDTVANVDELLPLVPYTYYASPYNDDPAVVTYYGIMFTIVNSDSPIEIASFELDTRYNLPATTPPVVTPAPAFGASPVTATEAPVAVIVENGEGTTPASSNTTAVDNLPQQQAEVGNGEISDWSVGVYTYEGGFEMVATNPSVWTQLADTQLVPVLAPDGSSSAIVPANYFTRVRLEPNEVRSFYITMQGPYIDNTVNALDDTGEVAFTSEHFSILTGAGLSNPNFPVEGIDRTTAPKFAGKIIYRERPDDSVEPPTCVSDSVNVTTQVHYKFMVGGALTTDITSAVTAAIDQVMEDLLFGPADGIGVDNLVLLEYVQQHSLGKARATKTSAGDGGADNCFDTGYTVCPTISGEIELQHSIGLDSGKLKFDMYDGAIVDAIMAQILEYIWPSEDAELFYVGQAQVSSDFILTLRNVPEGVLMDDVQKRYFESITEQYLQMPSVMNEANALVVHIENQESLASTGLRGRRRRRNRQRALTSWVAAGAASRILQLQQNGGDLRVSGRVYGTHRAGLADANFVYELQQALSANHPSYLAEVKMGLIRPGLINENDEYLYFAGITQLDSDLNLYYPPTTNVDDEDAPKDVPDNSTISTAPSAAPSAKGSGDTGNESTGGTVKDTLASVDTRTWIFIGVGVGVAVLVIAALIMYCIDRSAVMKRRKRKEKLRKIRKKEKELRNGTDEDNSSQKESALPQSAPAFEVDSQGFNADPLPNAQSLYPQNNVEVPVDDTGGVSFQLIPTTPPLERRPLGMNNSDHGPRRRAPDSRKLKRSKSLDSDEVLDPYEGLPAPPTPPAERRPLGISHSDHASQRHIPKSRSVSRSKSLDSGEEYFRQGRRPASKRSGNSNNRLPAQSSRPNEHDMSRSPHHGRGGSGTRNFSPSKSYNGEEMRPSRNKDRKVPTRSRSYDVDSPSGFVNHNETRSANDTPGEQMSAKSRTRNRTKGTEDGAPRRLPRRSKSSDEALPARAQRDIPRSREVRRSRSFEEKKVATVPDRPQLPPTPVIKSLLEITSLDQEEDGNGFVDDELEDEGLLLPLPRHSHAGKQKDLRSKLNKSTLESRPTTKSKQSISENPKEKKFPTDGKLSSEGAEAEASLVPITKRPRRARVPQNNPIEDDIKNRAPRRVKSLPKGSPTEDSSSSSSSDDDSSDSSSSADNTKRASWNLSKKKRKKIVVTSPEEEKEPDPKPVKQTDGEFEEPPLSMDWWK